MNFIAINDPSAVRGDFLRKGEKEEKYCNYWEIMLQ